MTVVDAQGKTYQTKRGGVVSTNRGIGRLKAFYNWAIEREYVTENPAQRIRKLREFEREPRLEPGEEERLRALTRDDWLWRLRIVAALETGCRVGEPPERPVQAAPVGPERAAPLEPDDNGPANALRAALAGAAGHAGPTTLRS